MTDSSNVYSPLIYGDVDLNFVDGSAIWLTSIVETLSQDSTVRPTLLLKSSVDRDGLLLRSIFSDGKVNVIDPWSKENYKLFSRFLGKKWGKGGRLQPSEACKIIDYLDQQHNYDFFIVRGYTLSKEISQNYTFSYRTWFYLTDFPQEKENVSDQDMRSLKLLYKNSSCIACQTPELIKYFKELLPGADERKFVYLPPMIPNFEKYETEFKNKNSQLIYVGKFAPYWKVPEMFAAFTEIEDLKAKLLVIGNKFHNYPFRENYRKEVTEVLTGSEKITWLQALPRDEVQHEIKKSDLGISLRDKALDDSKEVSTKILEYGLNGKPVIMNRNQLHERLFGPDYPLYANTEEEYKQKIKLALSDPATYEDAAKRMHRVSNNHTFSSIFNYLKPIIAEKAHDTQGWKNMEQRNFNKKNIVFAGHDLKFASMIIDYFNVSDEYNVKLDKWQGHNTHIEAVSRELLDWADIIIAEWGLGNAVWYSNNKKPNQKMVVRMHRQEKDTDYPNQINWDNIDQIIFIAPKLQEEMFETFPFLPKNKAKVIYNLVNTEKLDRPKLPDFKYNLGLQGIAPQMKRLDLAIEIFEKLWEKDNRYTLYIKGKLPTDYKWLWARVAEKEYYLNLFQKINSSPFRDSIVFDGWGDVSEWYPKIGFILSTSDFESFHLAVAEGMASGTIPVIRNWAGAAQLYPEKFTFQDVDEAVSIVQSFMEKTEEEYQAEMERARTLVKENYDKDLLCKQWEEVISHL